MDPVLKTHLGVYGVLVKNNQILLIKKARGPYTGKLDLPGGKIEHGEDIHAALQREIQEETNITNGTFHLLTNLSVTVPFLEQDQAISIHHIGLIYTVTDFDSVAGNGVAFEDSLGADWYTIAGLDPNALSPFARQILALL